MINKKRSAALSGKQDVEGRTQLLRGVGRDLEPFDGDEVIEALVSTEDNRSLYVCE